MEEKLLSRWFNSYNLRDFDALENLYSQDALIHSKDGPIHGGRSVAEIAKKWVHAIPDAEITPLSMSEEEDDLYVVHWRAEGTFKNAIRGLQPTGEHVTIHGFTCFRMENKKIVEHWACVDYKSLEKRRPALSR